MRRLWEPLGGWRTRALFHLLGYCLLLFVLLKYHEQGVATITARGEWELHVLGLVAAATMVLGARLIVLSLLTLWTWLCFAILLSARYGSFYFPAAEWTIWLALPGTACLAVVAALVRQVRAGARASETQYRAEVDWTVTRIFRVMACAVLGFAALHKLNRDFFDPELSCLTLRGYLDDWWHVPPALTGWITPLTVVVLEAAIPVMLVARPLIGILLTTALMFEFGSIGAVAFAGAVITLSLAFLPDADGERIARAARRRGWVPALVVAAVWGYGLLAYEGTYAWTVIALFQALAICAAWVAVECMRPRRPARAGAPERASPVARALVAAFALACVVNGLTPYLGLKFQYSFAMLSNLRVDDGRWNSFILPRAVRLTEHDPYVHLTRVRYTKMSTGQVFDGGGHMDPALYSPTVLRYRIQRAFERGLKVTFDFTYDGRAHAYLDTDDPAALYALIDALPHTPLWQGELDLGPQTCTH